MSVRLAPRVAPVAITGAGVVAAIGADLDSRAPGRSIVCGAKYG